MHKILKPCAGTIGAILALTIAANAMAPERLPAEGIRPLWTTRVQQNAPGNIFNGIGIVTAIEPVGTLTINHEPIEGLMPAMEMTFSANPRTLTKGVRPGDKVEFSVDGKTFTIVGLKVTGHTH